MYGLLIYIKIKIEHDMKNCVIKVDDLDTSFEIFYSFHNFI